MSMTTLTEEQIRSLDATVDACARTAATAEQIFEELERGGAQSGDIAAAIARHNNAASAHANLRSYVGATATAAGVPGLVPAARPDDRTRALMGDGAWGDVAALGDLLPRPLGKVALAGESAQAARADHVHPATDIFETGFATGGAGFRKISHTTELTAADPRKLSLRATVSGLEVRLPPVSSLEADGNAFLLHAEGVNGFSVTTSAGVSLGPDQGLVKAGSSRIFLLVDKASETWITADFAASSQNADPSQGGGSYRNPTLGTATVLISDADGHDMSRPNVLEMTPIDDTRLFVLWNRRIRTGVGNTYVLSNRIECAVISARDATLTVNAPLILLETKGINTSDYCYLNGRPTALVLDATRLLLCWTVYNYTANINVPEEFQNLNMVSLLRVEGNSLSEMNRMALAAFNKQASAYMQVFPLGADTYIILDRQYRKFLTVTINADTATQGVASSFTCSGNTNNPFVRLNDTDFLSFYYRNPSNQPHFLLASFVSYADETVSVSTEIQLPVNNIGALVACERISDSIFAAIIRDGVAPYGLRAVPLRVDVAKKTVEASSSPLTLAAAVPNTQCFCNKVRDNAFLVCYPTQSGSLWSFTATLVEYNDAFLFLARSSKTLGNLKSFSFQGWNYGNDQWRMVRLSDRVYAIPVCGTAANSVQGGAFFVYLNEELTEVESVIQCPFTPLSGTSGQEGAMQKPFLARVGSTVAVSYRADYLSTLIYSVAPITFS